MQVHAECNEDMIIRDRMQDNAMPYLQAKEERNLPLHTAHQDLEVSKKSLQFKKNGTTSIRSVMACLITQLIN